MNILPTIVQEVVSQCKKNTLNPTSVSSVLVTLVVRCHLLNARKDPSNNAEVSAEQVEQLVARVVANLVLPDSPQLEMFKLQASITALQQEQLNQFRTEKVQHKAKSHRLTEDVRQKKDANDVFTSIVLYILHECHMLQSSNGDRNSPTPVLPQQQQDPSNNNINSSEQMQKETVAALESVFPKVHMESFISQRETEKAHQLEEIWRIVWGIRIFNKETNKGGAGIPNIIQLTINTLESTTKATTQLKETLERSAKDYAAVLQSPSLSLTDKGRLTIQDEYHNRLQCIVYLRSLQETTLLLSSKSQEATAKYRSIIDETSRLVTGGSGGNTNSNPSGGGVDAPSSTAPVPKSAIYPRFIDLSEKWDVVYGLYREALDAKALLESISAFQNSFNSILNEADVQSAWSGKATERKPNYQLLASEIATTSTLSSTTDNNNGNNNTTAGVSVQYLPPEEKQTRLEFNGFCVVSFLDQGVLIDGCRDQPLGYLLLNANGAVYSFSSERAMRSFAKDPFRYLSQKLMDQVQNNCVLVYLLGLHPYLPKEVYLTGTRIHEIARVLETGDGASQTCQIDAIKDSHYQWNEWNLRRLALQLAGLRNKRTKSMQTHLSHFRRDNEMQVYVPKTQTTQTLVDAAVQPPREVQFLKGLRGSATSEIQTVKKTFLY